MSGSPTPRSLVPLVVLEASTLLSASGNAAATVVLPWLVLERTGSPGSAGVLAAATAIPLLASSLFSGTIVDLWGRRRTSVGSDVLSALSVAAIPLVDATLGLNLAWLVGLAVVGAVFDPAGVTARETMLPAVTQRAGWSLDRANSIHEAVWGVAFLVGPGVGGVMIAWFGSVTALWATAVGFTLSAVLVAGLRVADAGRPEASPDVAGMWRGTGDGLRFVWHDPLLRGLAVMTAVLVSVYMPIEGVLLPVYFEDLDEPGRLGGVIMAMSAGGVVGAVGYALAPAYHGRGVMPVALSRVIPVAFDPAGLALERLEAVAAAENSASRRVLEKCGFRFEGMSRGYLVIDGLRVDHARYGLLRSDMMQRERTNP